MVCRSLCKLIKGRGSALRYMSSYHYFVYGIYIRSEIRCSSLSEFKPESSIKPDAEILYGPTPDALEYPIAQGVLYTASIGKYLLQIPRVANYFVRHAKAIIVERTGECNDCEIALFLLASPFAALLQQRGQFVLHASAVLTTAGAVAFAGGSGVGKSTMAMALALASKGCRVLTDELCVVGIDSKGTPYLWPGAVDSLLWRDAIEMLGSDTKGLSKIRQGLEKYAFREQSNTDYQNPVALRRIYILSVTNKPTTSTSTIRGISKVQTLLQQQFNEKQVSDLRLKHSAFSFATKLSASIEIHNVRYPRTRRFLPMMVETIFQDIETIKLPCPTVTPKRSQEIPELTTQNLSHTPRHVHTSSIRAHYSTGKISENIIWMASYPKSGNTWLRVFLANYINDSKEPIDINKLAYDRATGLLASQRKLFDDFTGTEASGFTNTEIDSLRPLVYEQVSKQQAEHSTDPIFVKIHDALTFSKLEKRPLIPKTSTRAVIYVVRNPLDVCISYAHHFDVSIDESIQILNNENQTIGTGVSKHGLTSQLQQILTSWSGHYKSWVENQQNPILVVRFEDMQEKPSETFRNIVEFSGIKLNTPKLERAIRNSNFDLLRNQESVASFRENPSANAFFRQGVSGNWKEALSQSQVDLLIAQHGRIMRKLGYG